MPFEGFGEATVKLRFQHMLDESFKIASIAESLNQEIINIGTKSWIKSKAILQPIKEKIEKLQERYLEWHKSSEELYEKIKLFKVSGLTQDETDILAYRINRLETKVEKIYRILIFKFRRWTRYGERYHR